GPRSGSARSSPLRTALPERRRANSLAKLLERDADGRGRARQETAGRQARQRVHLEAPKTAVRVHPKIRAAIAFELQRPMRGEAERLDPARDVVGNIGREDLGGTAGLILRRIVEDRPLLRNDLANGE